MPGHCSVVTLGFAALALHASCAMAQDTSCPPNIGDRTVRHNLNIAAACSLDKTEIEGNVIVFAGGSLTAREVRIKGNLEASRAAFVDLERSRVDGNVTLTELVGDLTSLERNDLRGNVFLSANRSRLELVNNDIGGGLRATGNTGGLMLSGNSVDDELECSGNSPAPYGVGNRVDDADGQCDPLPAQAPTASPPPATPAPAPPAPTTSPPPTTSTPPATSTPPTTTAPPATTTPPATSTPPTTAPPPATSTPPTSAAVTDELADEGGVGSFGWPATLLLALLVWRRRAKYRP